MKKIILIVLLFIISIFINIPKYIELNNLMIIDRIEINCDSITFREVKPTKGDNGISYEYKTYTEDGTDINIIKKKYKNIYIEKSKIINKCKRKKR